MFPSSLITTDNLELKCSATCATENAKAVVIVVHGLGDHSRSFTYQLLEDFYADKDFALVRYDQRGHGVSEGRRRQVNSWREFRDDLGLVVRLARQEWPNCRIFLIGMSLGGLIALDYALHARDICGGVIALAPALSTDGVSRLVTKIVPFLSYVFPKVSIDPGLNPQNLSRDQNAAKIYTADPLFSTRVTMRLANEIMKGVSATFESAAKFKAPLLILHGEADVIVPASSSQNFFERVTSITKNRIVYPGALHNLLLETNREQVYFDIHNWLIDRLRD